MKYQLNQEPKLFYVTSPAPCPYLEGKIERRLVAELTGHDEINLHDTLSHVGFRRSHGIVYAPICPNCNACVAVRTDVLNFKPSVSQRRVLRTNKDVKIYQKPPLATREQYELFSKYQEFRHAGGDMSTMNYSDYQALIEETSVETFILEYRIMDVLVGACVVDQMVDGLSAVYSFFDPVNKRKSLGTHIVLKLILTAKQHSLPYVYLGYWVNGSQKMSYKEKFKPLEYYDGKGWIRDKMLKSSHRNPEI